MSLHLTVMVRDGLLVSRKRGAQVPYPIAHIALMPLSQWCRPEKSAARSWLLAMTRGMRISFYNPTRLTYRKLK